MSLVHDRLRERYDCTVAEAHALAEALALPFHRCIPEDAEEEGVVFHQDVYTYLDYTSQRPVVLLTLYAYRDSQVRREVPLAREMVRALARELGMAFRKKAGPGSDLVCWRGRKGFATWTLEVEVKTGLPPTCRVRYEEKLLPQKVLVVECT